MIDSSTPTPRPSDDRLPERPPVPILQAQTAPPPVVVLQAPTAPPPVAVPTADAAAPPVAVPRAGALVEASTYVPRTVGRAERWLGGRRRLPASCVISALVHAAALILLGLWMTELDRSLAPPSLLASATVDTPTVRPLEHANSGTISAGGVSAAAAPRVSEMTVDVTVPIESPTRAVATALPSALGGDALSNEQLLTDVGRGTLGPLDGRTGALKGELLASEGGTPQSEEAVAAGLRWLAAHQREDGAWHFDHNLGPCAGQCSHPGSEGSTTGATGMALMCFLGAGQTHREGQYQQVVEHGLNYLRGRMLPTQYGGDLQEGTMYGHALATIALCEAFAMTDDRSLEDTCFEAVRFIVSAQHPAGGWRYVPGQPGDMTVTGWQLMALKSGQLKYLPIPTNTIGAVSKFLDGLATEDGAAYGYQSKTIGRTTTSVGLLCRMYLGWPKSNAALRRGVAHLSRDGFSKNDMYFNYYATQVLHHWGGAQWFAWNNDLRDYLVGTQATVGHEAGSWYFDDEHRSGEKGGRLYNTCMGIMTLEVYYRYLPLYGQEALNKAF